MQNNLDLLAGGLAAIGLSISVEKTKSMVWHRKGHVISQEVYNARQPQPAAEVECGVVRWNGEKWVITQPPVQVPRGRMQPCNPLDSGVPRP